MVARRPRQIARVGADLDHLEVGRRRRHRLGVRTQIIEHVEKNGHRELGADQLGTGPPIEIPQPHTDGKIADRADRPRVALTKAGARLPEHGRRRRIGLPRGRVGPALFGQRARGQPAGPGREHAHRAGRRLARQNTRPSIVTTVGQRGVGRSQLERGDLDRAQNQRQPHALRLQDRAAQLQPRQERHEPLDADVVQEPQKDRIERARQRVFGAHQPAVMTVVVAGRPAAPPLRHVFEQEVRLDQTEIERGGIQERLERRARRARRGEAGDLPVVVDVVKIEIADERADFRRAMVDDHDGAVPDAGLSERPPLRAQDALGGDLHRAIERGVQLELVGMVRAQPKRGVRRQLRKAANLVGGRQGEERRDLQPLTDTRHRSQQRGFVLPVRRASPRLLRHRQQRQNFRRAEDARVVAEEALRRGLDAFEISAVGQKPQIGRQNFGASIAAAARSCSAAAAFDEFTAQRPRHAARACAPAAMVKVDALRLPPAGGNVAPRRARDGQRIDAGMVKEAMVLVANERVEVVRGRGHRRRRAAAICRRTRRTRRPRCRRENRSRANRRSRQARRQRHA